MKHVLITGGSRGIGAAAVQAFASKGYKVSFLYKESLAAAQSLCRSTGATALRCDVADCGAVEEAIVSLPPVDILVNNAGVAHYGLISQISCEEWNRLFAVNVNGVFHCVRAVLPGMLRKQEGCIINLSSMWGQVGASCEVAYSASKGAVIAMTKALAKELGPSNIRVNCVCPGVIETDMVNHLGEDVLDALAQEAPLGRNGAPQEVAEALLYLAEAEFVTGQILAVNGGIVV
ncbi:MAG: SDR family oxidoreductase [Oscillospiraceae bacterium]|nr:SDR family oxidoreductase [Oscillospiraceae bacterium]